MEETRTANTLRIIKSSAILYIVTKIMSFIVKTVFIRVMTTDYLGVNGLFGNILSFLNFTELGIGSAIIYHLYKPVAENNIPKIKSLMQFYKKAYYIIALIILVGGLCVIPFMDFIIKEPPNIHENLIIIYLIFLFQTVSSYFFSYKRSIIFTNQKNNITNYIDCIANVIANILELIVLIITKSFILYLITAAICAIITNIVIAYKANKMYPYLKEKNIDALNKKEKSNIFKSVKALAVYQLGEVVLYSSDNIIISVMLNITMVGLCSNYVLLLDTVKVIFNQIMGGMDASVGNLNASEDIEKKEKVFYEIMLSYFLVFSFATVAFCVLANPFVKIWAGSEYVLSVSIPIALAISFFITGLNRASAKYRMTLGLFKKAKITPIISLIVNIVFSIILCKVMGVLGVFVATILAKVASFTWIDPHLIYKNIFKKSIKIYYMKYIKYFILLIIELLICFTISSFITVDGFIGLGLKAVIVSIIPNLINYIVLSKTPEMKNLKERIYTLVAKKWKRSRNSSIS